MNGPNLCTHLNKFLSLILEVFDGSVDLMEHIIIFYTQILLYDTLDTMIHCTFSIDSFA